MDLVRIDNRTNLEDLCLNQALQVRRHLQEPPERWKSFRPEETIEAKKLGLKGLGSHTPILSRRSIFRSSQRISWRISAFYTSQNQSITEIVIRHRGSQCSRNAVLE